MQRLEEHATGGGHIAHGGIEHGLVGLRRRVKAVDLADELQRRVTKLVVGGLTVGMSQTLDVPAHGEALSCYGLGCGSAVSLARR